MESRADYLARVKTNHLATLVKIADARDNRDDDARPGMVERYTWVLAQLGVDEQPNEHPPVKMKGFGV